MKTNHLSDREQEEYLLEQRTPRMLHHVADCAHCQDAIARLEQTIGLFRAAAIEYSAMNLAGRPQRVVRRQAPMVPLRWAFAALAPLVLLILALLPLHWPAPKSHPVQAPITDDALLEQVDEQLSVTVPDSMESLTHLVTTEGGSGARSRPVAQSN